MAIVLTAKNWPGRDVDRLEERDGETGGENCKTGERRNAESEMNGVDQGLRPHVEIGVRHVRGSRRLHREVGDDR